MRKLILVLGLVAATVSCTKRQNLDCNCDRIESVSKMYIVDYQSSTNQVDTIEHTGMYDYITVNDCSEERKRIADFSGVEHKVGDCY